MSDYTHTKPTRVRMNPSRSTCEEIIRRILTTEQNENGINRHFKNATDFMSYFESLYPAGPALTKQVQRAIKSMDLAKDDNGFFLIDKTKKEQGKEKELSSVLKKSDASLEASGNLQGVFLKIKKPYEAYILDILDSIEASHDYYITALSTYDGILFITEDAAAFSDYIKPFL